MYRVHYQCFKSNDEKGLPHEDMIHGASPAEAKRNAEIWVDNQLSFKRFDRVEITILEKTGATLLSSTGTPRYVGVCQEENNNFTFVDLPCLLPLGTPIICGDVTYVSSKDPIFIQGDNVVLLFLEKMEEGGAEAKVIVSIIKEIPPSA